MAITMKITVFWHVTPRSFTDITNVVEEPAVFISRVPETSSEKSVIFYTTMLHIRNRYSSPVSRTCGCCTIIQDSDCL
jgi:hypothetical protein